MLFVSTAHSFLRLIIALLLLKNAAIWAKQIERRSLFFGGASAGIQYANHNPTVGAPLTPAVFSHQVYHDFNLPYHQQQHQQRLPQRALGTGSLIPIVYGSSGSGASSFFSSGTKYLPPPPPSLSHVSSNHLSNGLVEEDVPEPYYYHGDRILKQYLVDEKAHRHDLLINPHTGNPFQPATILRYETRQLPFGGIVDVPVFDTNELEQRLHPFKPSSLRKNHGPIALGSGSLGLIALPNGNVYLGSGSLGYVSEQQHLSTLTRATPRPFLTASPVQFGSNAN